MRMGPRGLGTGLAQPYGLRNMSARRTSPPLRGAWIVARKELTESLRDRATVIYAFVLPICMYPVLFWAILQGVMVVEGLQDRTETTLGIAAAGVPAEEHDTATEGLTHALSPPSEDPDEPAVNSLKLIWAQESMDMEQAREWLAEDSEEDTEDAPDKPDAVLFLDPLTILHVSTKSSSNLASKRARRRLESHASALRQEAADRAGLEAADLDPKRFPPRSVLNAISQAKAQLQDAAAFRAQVSSYYEEIVQRIYEAYQGLLTQSQAVDFDDLLLRTHHLFRDQPQVLDRYQERYQHLHVDDGHILQSRAMGHIQAQADFVLTVEIVSGATHALVFHIEGFLEM